MFQPVPKVAVVVDTSGSMSDAELSRCLGEIKGIISASGVGGKSIYVLSVDAAVHKVQKVVNVKDVKLFGGGGTDMEIGIKSAAKYKPDVIIVLTDGYTPWPEEKIVDSKVIACIISDGYGYVAERVPKWIKTIVVDADT